MKYVLFAAIAGVAIFSLYYGLNVTTSPEETSTPVIKGKVIKAGLFKVIRSGGLVASTKTSTGKAISKPVIQLVKVTNRIPLIKDAHMSLQYRIWNLPEQPAYIKLKRVLKHPPITLPDGSVSTGSEYMITGSVSVGQVIAYTGYGLNEDYEMQAGDWTFQIWLDDKKLIEQTFTTYLPDETEKQQLGNLSPKKAVTTGSGNPAGANSMPTDPAKKTPSVPKRSWIRSPQP